MRRSVAALFTALVAFQTAAAEPSFSDWMNAAPGRRAEVVAFERFLERNRVDGILPTDDLLRNASSWKACGLRYPWSMPPRALWPHVVSTLRFIRDEVVPAVGPVTVESGYREPALNRCSGGAPKSAHALFYALDLVPHKPVARRQMIAALCRVHARKGKRYDIGLGFYNGLRFHIDAKLYRRWGSDNHAKTSPCAGITG